MPDLSSVAREAAEQEWTRSSRAGDAELYIDGFTECASRLPSEEAIAEVLDAHRLIEGSDFAWRLNGDWWCTCRWHESRSGHLAHQAEAVRALFGEVA